MSTTTYGDIAPDLNDYDLPLVICGTRCTGRRATASDPLAQYQCPLTEVHYPQEAAWAECYKPQRVEVYDEEEEGT